MSKVRALNVTMPASEVSEATAKEITNAVTTAIGGVKIMVKAPFKKWVVLLYCI